MIVKHFLRCCHHRSFVAAITLQREAQFAHQTAYRQIYTSSIKCNKDLSSQDQESNPLLDVFRNNATKWWSGKEFSILRSMNQLRVPWISNGLDKPIIEAKILDVGCGGGILSEPLARLGANVLGIDPVYESINQAQLHAQADPELEGRLKYHNCNIEDLSGQEEHIEAYDAVVASEVLEHIEDVESFLAHCTKLLKPGGSLFITTINQTPMSWLGVIFFGEYVLRQLPKGTHSYDMFVNVKGLQVMLERMGYHIRLVNGFMYEPFRGNFYWTPTKLTHYAMQAIKQGPPMKGLNIQQRRNAPKGKKHDKRPRRPLDDDEMIKVIPLHDYRRKAAEIINEFQNHLDTRLSTRTSTQAFETLKIKVAGLDDSLELRDIAQLSLKSGNLIVINLSTMPDAIKPTLEALRELGNVQPQVEVSNIYVPVPRVTREHREKLVSAARQLALQSKEKLRSLFSEYSKRAKALSHEGSGVSKDLVYDTTENLLFDVNQKIEELEKILKKRTDLLLNQKSD